MKKISIITLLSVLILSCGSEKTNQPSAPKESKIFAVYTKPDGTKQPDILLRIITKTIKYDSAKGKDVIATDTIYGVPRYLPLRDSTGKEILDSNGNKRISPVPEYFQIGKDSVNWRVENKDVDSLIKRN